MVDYRFPSGTESEYSTYKLGNPDALRELFLRGMNGALEGSGLELPEAQGQAPELQIMPLLNSGGHDHWSMDCAVYTVQGNTLSVLFVYRQPYPYTDQTQMVTDLGTQIGTFLRGGWACTGPDYFGAGGTASAL